MSYKSGTDKLFSMFILAWLYGESAAHQVFHKIGVLQNFPNSQDNTYARVPL